MKNKMNKVSGLLASLSLAWFLGACSPVNQYDYSPYENIFLEEGAHLTDDASSPLCDFSMDYSFLKEENDSVAMVINREMQREFLGGDYAALAPEAAIDSFKNTYIRNYREETGKLYAVLKAQASSEEEIPAWFDHTYSMVNFLDDGREGIIHVAANMYVDTGGAHPNQWARWLNFDSNTGKRLSQEDVFKPEAKQDIEQLLLLSLIARQADENPEEKVETLEDLQKLGFLQLTSIYIPDNFILGKEEVSFLFNRYDIAPYSAGEIVLRISYEKIGPFMKI